MTTPALSNLSKMSDKVLAKFARRAATMKMVCVAVHPEQANLFEDVIMTVKVELDRRGVKWDGAAE